MRVRVRVSHVHARACVDARMPAFEVARANSAVRLTPPLCNRVCVRVPSCRFCWLGRKFHNNSRGEPYAAKFGAVDDVIGCMSMCVCACVCVRACIHACMCA